MRVACLPLLLLEAACWRPGRAAPCSLPDPVNQASREVRQWGRGRSLQCCSKLAAGQSEARAGVMGWGANPRPHSCSICVAFLPV